jgi:trimeric autotransporter adhesin
MTKSVIEGHTLLTGGGGGGAGGVPDDGSVTTPKIADGAVTSNKIFDGTIVDADVSPSAAIALSKLAGDPLARANHTGTQPSSTITGLGALAALNTVTSAELADGTIVDADVSPGAAIASAKIAGLGTLAAKNAVGSADITDGSIVDADVNASAAIALSKLATDPLARANHTGTQTAATISDFSAAVGAVAGGGVDATLYNAHSILKADVDDTPVALAVPSSTFVGRGAAGAITTLDAAAAKTVLALSPTDIGTVPIASGGTGAITAPTARSALGVPGKFTAAYGDGAATSFTVNHGLNRTSASVQVYDVTTGETIEADVTRISSTQVTVGGFVTPPSAGGIQIIVMA